MTPTNEQLMRQAVRTIRTQLRELEHRDASQQHLILPIRFSRIWKELGEIERGLG